MPNKIALIDCYFLNLREFIQFYKLQIFSPINDLKLVIIANIYNSLYIYLLL